jgi:hypothetical protein
MDDHNMIPGVIEPAIGVVKCRFVRLHLFRGNSPDLHRLILLALSLDNIHKFFKDGNIPTYFQDHIKIDFNKLIGNPFFDEAVPQDEIYDTTIASVDVSNTVLGLPFQQLIAMDKEALDVMEREDVGPLLIQIPNKPKHQQPRIQCRYHHYNHQHLF